MAEAITTSWHRAGRIEGMQDLVLRRLNRKFGPLAEGVEERVRAITDEEELESLDERLVTGASLQDLGLDQ